MRSGVLKGIPASTVAFGRKEGEPLRVGVAFVGLDLRARKSVFPKGGVLLLPGSRHAIELEVICSSHSSVLEAPLLIPLGTLFKACADPALLHRYLLLLFD